MFAAIAKRSLSTKLLLLTIIFVFLAEFVVLVPSIAKQRRDWFNLRFEEAYLVSITLEGPREAAADEALVRQLFSTANILGVTINSDDMRMLILAPEINPHGAPNIRKVDLTGENWLDLIANAWGAVFSRGDYLIQATGRPEFLPDQSVDIIVSQEALRKDLLTYARNIFLLSLVISTLTAGLVYWSLNRIIVWPVKRLTANIAAFAADPENAKGIITPSGRSDEIGAAEECLATMETSVRELLGERRRLAALGAGISKISHDLRNILASAQLMSDRLAKSDDPSVRKLSPRLISALDRAITLSRDTLTFGRMGTSLLDKSSIALHDLVEEVLEDTAAMGVTPENNTPADLSIIADRTQLYRALFNLVRNAVEAMLEVSDENSQERGKISIDAAGDGDDILITITDTGPGLPEHAKAELFEPFKGSRKPGGSGLGVAIAAEIVRAHGGALTLHKSDETGAAFRLRLPRNG